jgi:hypothetical protein
MKDTTIPVSLLPPYALISFIESKRIDIWWKSPAARAEMQKSYSLHFSVGFRSMPIVQYIDSLKDQHLYIGMKFAFSEIAIQGAAPSEHEK